MYAIVVSHGMQISYKKGEICVLKKKVFLLVAGAIVYNTLKVQCNNHLTVTTTHTQTLTAEGELRNSDVGMKSSLKVDLIQSQSLPNHSA